jgi:hypothetical protein
VIFAPNFSLKSSENNTPINSYHAPGGFGKVSDPAAVERPPQCDKTECRSHQHDKKYLKINVIFFISVFVTKFFRKCHRKNKKIRGWIGALPKIIF